MSQLELESAIARIVELETEVEVWTTRATQTALALNELKEMYNHSLEHINTLTHLEKDNE
jgi:hypothetical protein